VGALVFDGAKQSRAGHLLRATLAANPDQPVSVQVFPLGARNALNAPPHALISRPEAAGRRPTWARLLLHSRGMTWDRIKADWKDFRGRARVMWGKLTDSELARIRGNREQLEAALQKRYGIAKAEARRQVDAWVKTLKVRIEGKAARKPAGSA
jgi:uncharacterized protein YjbJ (UPF0337 family)